MDLHELCPLLVAQNRQHTVFEGFLKVKNQQFQVRIELPDAGNVADASISCESDLKQLLLGYESLLAQRLQHCSDLPAFLREFKDIIERQLEQHNVVARQPPPPTFYSQLIQQIDELGWCRLSYIDGQFRQLHLMTEDHQGREHTLKVCLAEQHPVQTPICLTQLPESFTPVWTSKSTLKDLFLQFESSLAKYEDFWAVMDDIDQNTWVLEPEKPTRNATSRRLALGSSASVLIEVDPRHPRDLPECHFFGPDHIVNPLRKNLNKNLNDWEPSYMLLQNLADILEVDFPSPASSKKEDFNLECGICYAYRLEGDIPSHVCDDPKCSQAFHHACLYEWLRALPSSRHSFNVVFGECPYCGKWLRALPSSRHSFNVVFGECPYCGKPITVKIPAR